MNWNVFFAVITWAVTLLSGVGAIAVALWIAMAAADHPWDDTEWTTRTTLAIGIMALITIIGAATIGGMGWGG